MLMDELNDISIEGHSSLADVMIMPGWRKGKLILFVGSWWDEFTDVE